MYRKFYLRPAIIMRYLIKFIISPSNIGTMIKAGFNVVKYSLDGYPKKKFQSPRAAPDQDAKLSGIVKTKALK